MRLSILLTGVGGHGILTAASILGKASLKAGYNVLVSEVHGMAQRGGIVNCNVRIGDVYSPLIPKGGADVIISTEPIEALRQIDKANEKTLIITDVNPVIPPTIYFSEVSYPKVEKVLEELGRTCKLCAINAGELAKKAGNVLAKNVVLLGALSAFDVLPFDSKLLLETIAESLPYKDVNTRAFKLGEEEVRKKYKGINMRRSQTGKRDEIVLR